MHPPSAHGFKALVAMWVAILGVAWLWIARDSRPAAWQRHALSVVEDVAGARARLDRESPDAAQLVAHLQELSAPVLPILPDALAARPAIGCKSWEWRGLKFALLSFRLDAAGTAHLVTTYHGGLKGAPPLGHMIHGRSGKWNTATWSEGGLACMLFTDADEATLRALVAAHGATAPKSQVASR